MPELNTMIDYCKENWSDVLLLAFTVWQCISTIACLLQKRWDSFFMCAPVYFPTLFLLVANMFFGLSWPALTGYVLGISLTMTISVWTYSDGTGSSGKIISNAISTILICLYLL